MTTAPSAASWFLVSVRGALFRAPPERCGEVSKQFLTMVVCRPNLTEGRKFAYGCSYVDRAHACARAGFALVRGTSADPRSTTQSSSWTRSAADAGDFKGSRGSSAGASGLESQNGMEWRGRIGQAFTVQCSANGTPTAWGTDVYTDDSSVCTAAVPRRTHLHSAGRSRHRVRVARTGVVRSSTRRGIATAQYPQWPGSFGFRRPPASMIPQTPAGATLISWENNGVSWRDRSGQSLRLYCPPNGTTGSVWGSGPYTDASQCAQQPRTRVSCLSRKAGCSR